MSATVRHIGPTRMLSPAPIIPSVLTSSLVGARPTMLLTAAGQRTDTTVSSPMAHVTRFAATAVPEPALDMPGSRSVSYGLQKVPPNELRAPSTAYSARFALARMMAPASPQLRHERRIVRRPIVRVLRVGAGRRAHVLRVVLILDGDHHAVKRADAAVRCARTPGPAPPRFRAHPACRTALSSAIGHAARLAGVEAPALAGRRPEIQRGERVDLPGARDGRDRAEDALRLVHARAVIGLDAPQVLLDDPHGRDALALKGALDVGDGRLVDVEGSGALRITAGRADHDHRQDDANGTLPSVFPVHARTISLLQ